MTNDDLLFRHRLQLFARAAQVGVRRACRELGFHHSTYYRWRPRVEAEGLEILRPRERRPPRMPNQTPPWREQQIIAFALGHPGLGPRRIAAQIALVDERISANAVHKVLRRHGIATRRRRLALVAGYAAPPEPERPLPPEPHIKAKRVGDVVQFDCFHVGRLQGTKGKAWQYTATDVVSGFLWAELAVSETMNPQIKHCSALVRRVAAELAAAGWQLRRVTTDRGSEFIGNTFRRAVRSVGATQRVIASGRPQSNGCVERVQRTILEECWRPSFARSLVPSFFGLREDLERYVRYFNYERAHLGRHTKGRTPATLVYGARKMKPR
jgi:transposase InsO family protein